MRLVLCAGIGVLLAGCGNGRLPTAGGGSGGERGGEPSGVEHISTVVQRSGPIIQAPDKVNAGLGFNVSFSTVEFGCDGPDKVTSETAAASVTLTPYNRDVHDSTYATGAVCPDYGTEVVRTARVALAAPGFDTLSVHAYTLMLDGSAQLGTVQKIIEVLP